MTLPRFYGHLRDKINHGGVQLTIADEAKEKHAMRYIFFRGLTRVKDWVTLKFAAMNLKKIAVWAC